MACHLWRGEWTDESPSLARLELAQTLDREARQRQCATAQFGLRRHDDLMAANPLQTALDMLDACAQINVTPLQTLPLFCAHDA